MLLTFLRVEEEEKEVSHGREHPLIEGRGWSCHQNQHTLQQPPVGRKGREGRKEEGRVNKKQTHTNKKNKKKYTPKAKEHTHAQWNTLHACMREK